MKKKKCVFHFITHNRYLVCFDQRYLCVLFQSYRFISFWYFKFDFVEEGKKNR